VPRLLLFLVVSGILVSTEAVRGESPPPLRQLIDAEVQTARQLEQIAAPGTADDATFLRRIHLDLIGTIPTHDEARRFLEDTATDKRAVLIDALLKDPRFARHQASTWQSVLFEREPARGGQVFNNWLSDKLSRNVPYDRWVRELLMAEGNTRENGPPLFYAQFKVKPESTAIAVSRMLLGVQIQCAQCHDHPHDRWKQRDFYGLTGFFVRLSLVTLGDRKEMIGERRTGEVVFVDPTEKDQPGKKGEPVPARFLGGDVLDEPPVAKGFKQSDLKTRPNFSRKEKFADWLVAVENPFFARAAVNRIWAQYMGRGLIHPIDDLRESRRPSHPELLEALRSQFVAHGFDIQWLTREIVNGQAYQRGRAREATDTTWYGSSRVRPLTPEEMVTALRQASGVEECTTPLPEKTLSDFSRLVLQQFGEALDSRGDYQASLTERLFMNNSKLVREILEPRKGNLADRLLTSEDPWEEKVDRLFLSVLSRRPSDSERQHFVTYLTSDKDTRALVVEAIWALITSSQFRFNH